MGEKVTNSAVDFGPKRDWTPIFSQFGASHPWARGIQCLTSLTTTTKPDQQYPPKMIGKNEKMSKKSHVKKFQKIKKYFHGGKNVFVFMNKND